MIEINGKKYVKDGSQVIEKDKLDAHKKRMKTYFKFGGKIHDARMATGIVKKEGEEWEHKQKD